jgi:predicted phosphate transport protein (TIGR00153 family)
VRWLRRIFASGVDEVVRSAKLHLRLSLEAVQVLRDLVSQGTSSKSIIDECARKVAALESEGDNIAREVIDKIARGAVVPTVLHVVAALVSNMDDILDTAYFALKEMKRGSHMWSSAQVQLVIVNDFKEMLDLASLMLEYVYRMLEAAREDELRHYAELARSLEEEVDEVKEAVLDKIYGLNASAVEFNHLLSLIYAADRIADSARDLANHILLLLTSAR